MKKAQKSSRMLAINNCAVCKKTCLLGSWSWKVRCRWVELSKPGLKNCSAQQFKKFNKTSYAILFSFSPSFVSFSIIQAHILNLLIIFIFVGIKIQFIYKSSFCWVATRSRLVNTGFKMSIMFFKDNAYQSPREQSITLEIY